MPSIPELILGFSLTMNHHAHQETTQTQSIPVEPFMKPFVGAKWKDSMLVAEFALQHSYQYRKIGETEYISHEGITSIGLDYRKNFLQKKSTEAFWGFGASVDIPTVNFTENEEDTSSLGEQIWTELFSVDGRFSIGARKYWGNFFVGMKFIPINSNKFRH